MALTMLSLFLLLNRINFWLHPRGNATLTHSFVFFKGSFMANMAMRTPLGKDEFVKKGNFDGIYLRLTEYEIVEGQSMPSTIILTGEDHT